MADIPFRYGPASLTGAAATLFTYTGANTGTNGTGSYTGQGTIRIVKEIRLVNETAGALWATVSLGTDGTGKRLANQVAVPANGMVTIGCWIPMFGSASEVIQAYCQTANGITIELAGVDS